MSLPAEGWKSQPRARTDEVAWSRFRKTALPVLVGDEAFQFLVTLTAEELHGWEHRAAPYLPTR